MTPLTPDQQATVERLWPRVRRTARAIWADDEAESVAAVSLCEAVRDGKPDALALAAVRGDVRNARERASRRTGPCFRGDTPAPEEAPFWEVFTPDEEAVVEEFVRHTGDREAAIRAAAKRLGLPREVFRARLARAEARLTCTE